jgi:hypothetical protein
MWGRGIKEVGEDEKFHKKLLEDGDLSLGMWRGGVERYVLCV